MALNNGFGTGIYFSSQVFLTGGISGSIESFTLNHTAEKKEIIDGNDNFIYIGIGKRKTVANATVILTSSGSNIATPAVGDTATLASPWTTDVSGTWGVTDAKLMFKSDDAAKVDIELTQWYKTGGGTLP